MKLLQKVAGVLGEMPNAVQVGGHTDSRPYAPNSTKTNWELSFERADAARRVLETNGLRPKQVSRVLAFADSQPLKPDDPMLGLEARLHTMDEAGVAVSILSFAPVGVIADTRVARSLCRAANDGLLEACAAHPDRFVMAAALPLPDPAAADEELARIESEDAVRAVQVVAQTTGYVPDDPAFADGHEGIPEVVAETLQGQAGFAEEALGLRQVVSPGIPDRRFLGRHTSILIDL